MQQSRKRTYTFLISLVIFPLMVWSCWYEPRSLVVREVELHLPGLTPAQDGLRVALISDLHVGAPYQGLSQLSQIVKRVNGAHPDLVLFLGDLMVDGLDGQAKIPPEKSAVELAKLTAPLGVYGVMGNHDWWYGAFRVAKALRQGGLHLLENTSQRLVVRGRPLWLAGVSDVYEGKDDLAAALEGIPQRDPVILLSHNPDIFPSVPEQVALTVSGHTHGGQIKLPVVGALFVPSRFGQRYLAGHIVEEGRHLFVTVGTGNLQLPVRFRVPPEIVVLTLRSSN